MRIRLNPGHIRLNSPGFRPNGFSVRHTFGLILRAASFFIASSAAFKTSAEGKKEIPRQFQHTGRGTFSNQRCFAYMLQGPWFRFAPREKAKRELISTHSGIKASMLRLTGYFFFLSTLSLPACWHCLHVTCMQSQIARKKKRHSQHRVEFQLLLLMFL